MSKREVQDTDSYSVKPEELSDDGFVQASPACRVTPQVSPMESHHLAKPSSVLSLAPFLYASIHDLDSDNLNNALCGPSLPYQDVDLFYIMTETHPGTLNPFALKRKEWRRVRDYPPYLEF